MPKFKIIDLANVLLNYYKKRINYKKKIIFTGIRSGERLNEELFLNQDHKKIFKFKNLIIINDKIKTKNIKKFYNIKEIKIYKANSNLFVASKKYIFNYLYKNNLI
ncbi:MAG: polysaccharide biosynthesis protein [Candidatus Pelagibacter sp.]